MDIEKQIEREIEVLEKIRPVLGRFFKKRVYGEWKLKKEDVRLLDEVGFGLTGVPIYGPEIKQEIPHIDIAVIEEKYQGPRSWRQDHPIKLLFPRDEKTGNYYKEEIYQEDKLDVDDILKGKPKFFKLPTVEVNLIDGVGVRIPKPVDHVEYFATDTILNYTEDDVGEDKFKEWFTKLLMIKEVANHRKLEEVEKKADEMILLSRTRWRHKGWSWLSKDGYENEKERVVF